MHPRLAEILEQKRNEVKRLKESGLPPDKGNDIPPVRDFKGAISREGGVNLIAEIKFASPSAGVILKEGDPVPIARIYEGAGAGAISVLTDQPYFCGDIRYIPRVRQAVSLPVLRKDFIIDPIQVKESLVYGADAILLIAGILSPNRLKQLLAAARESAMACLTEVHDRRELETAIACGANIIGINNRDLNTFEVDMDTTFHLATLIPDGCIRISESGISSGADISRLGRSGIHAVLVGTSLMQSKDIGARVRELVEAGRDHDAG